MEQHLSYYKIFYEVAKAGNISKAAKELYISQPAISKSISKLEENLEINLFSRNSRGVTLTTEGKLLFEHVEAAFNSILTGEEQLKKAKELGIGKLRIGASATLSKMLLLPYLKKFIAKYPQVNINLSSQSSTQTIDMLEAGILDLGLVAKPANKRSFSFLPLIDIHDIFVVSPAYLEKLGTDNAAQALISGNVILLDNKNATRTYINDYLYTHSINISRPLEVSTMDLIIDFTKIGLGIGCVIKEFVENELKSGELIELNLEKNIRKRTVGFAYLGSNPNPTLKTFLEI